ncbi:MAG TPA: polyprenyl synthetase family protein [Pirellulales bacterium]|jgi:octaprenyl-diphosphate synthase|nr:polyprenyl synthetase family protein [Pirellulales bacterium]
MSQVQVTEARASLPSRLKALYQPIHEELGHVEEILRNEARSQFPAVDELLKHSFRLGGKRLRPALLLLVGKAVGGQVGRPHLVLSAVMEMIHTATLVHDDVLDEAAVRRHLDTVNARWNNQLSILLGDFLFSHAFYLASTVGSVFACRQIGRSTNIVCEGELRQVTSQGDLTLTEGEYLRVIDAKTAQLCACCCTLGAHYSGAGKSIVAEMRRYGRYLGIAFQIVDDLLDLVGDEGLAGKSLGSDLEQGKLTLPLIRLLEQLNEADRRRLAGVFKQDPARRRGELGWWLDRSDALDYARARAAAYVRRAAARLHVLPASREREALRRLGRFVLERGQ